MEYRSCKICGKVFTAPYKSYPKLTCSKGCAQLLIKEVNLERYGVENPQQLQSVKEKTKRTNLERYGAEYFLQTEVKKEKTKKTNLERYGSEHHLRIDDIKNKQKLTNLERYGVENPQQLQSVKEKTKRTRREKYGVDHMLQSERSRDKLVQTTFERYGVYNYSQTAEYKERYKKTSVERYGVENFNQRHMDPDVIAKLNDPEWITEQAYSDESVKTIADRLGIQVKLLYDRFSKFGVIPKRFKTSSVEHEILEFIKGFTSEIVQGSRKIIPPKEIDIYLPKFKFAIEVNGIYWHTEVSGKKDKNYHVNKTILCKEQGIDLFHISDIEWDNKNEIIKSLITSRLGALDKIHARKCRIAYVDTKEEKEFLDKNHLQGYVASKYAIGLYYDTKLVSIMTFGKNRFGNHGTELLRFCNKLNTIVIGGASRLFSHFVKHTYVDNIISYSHRDKFSGNLYKQLGFAYSHSSAPSYHYTTDYEFLENRIKYQKHKLSNLFSVFNPEITEWENMQNNGYDRIWDCGNDVWVWKR